MIHEYWSELSVAQGLAPYKMPVATQACFLFLPRALLAFLAGVGGAFLWAHEFGSIARRDV